MSSHLYPVNRDPDPILRRDETEAEKHRRLMAEAAQVMAEVKQAYDHLAWVITEIKRQRQKDFYKALQAGIRKMHRCRSRHVATFAVRKVAGEKTVWEGYVEEFQLLGCDPTQTCYAWHYQEWGRTRSFSVLKLPPVFSPQSAVQLALAARDLLPPNPF